MASSRSFSLDNGEFIIAFAPINPATIAVALLPSPRAGGTASKHFKNFKSDLCLKQFLDKGRLKDILKTKPVKVILDEEFGLFSAACRANMLLKT